MLTPSGATSSTYQTRARLATPDREGQFYEKTHAQYPQGDTYRPASEMGFSPGAATRTVSGPRVRRPVGLTSRTVRQPLGCVKASAHGTAVGAPFAAPSSKKPSGPSGPEPCRTVRGACRSGHLGATWPRNPLAGHVVVIFGSDFVIRFDGIDRPARLSLEPLIRPGHQRSRVDAGASREAPVRLARSAEQIVTAAGSRLTTAGLRGPRSDACLIEPTT